MALRGASIAIHVVDLEFQFHAFAAFVGDELADQGDAEDGAFDERGDIAISSRNPRMAKTSPP